ncbi:hypothetical protein V6N13_074198 [Hibiscus sabdariffa]|uniref:Uncharacterized protein n=1 Tax=Hibiscus sabdariffa TaxID=183260 RepID=A0ABR2U850_9ROSI
MLSSVCTLHISTSPRSMPKNVFGLLMRSGFLCLRNGSIVVTIEIYNIDMLGITPNSVMNFLIQTASLAASLVAIYSASVVESATMSCFELFQLTAPPLRQNTKPDCDRESSLSVWKLASL